VRQKPVLLVIVEDGRTVIFIIHVREIASSPEYGLARNDKLNFISSFYGFNIFFYQILAAGEFFFYRQF